MIGATFNTIMFDFPPASALSLLFGCVVVGFFIAIDMALDRERHNILMALNSQRSLPLGDRLFPVTRKFFLVAVSTALIVTVVIVLVISRDIVWLSKIEQSESALIDAQLSVSYEIFFIMGILLAMVINLIYSYSKNLKILFQNETSVLEQVSRGDLSGLVPVATNDEFGLIAAHTNSMIQGLRHRIRLISALKLAEEVQRNLLPNQAPKIPGLDISGISIYCDETGGDYYDYLNLAGRPVRHRRGGRFRSRRQCRTPHDDCQGFFALRYPKCRWSCGPDRRYQPSSRSGQFADGSICVPVPAGSRSAAKNASLGAGWT